MAVTLVSGVPGVGLSTITREARRGLDEEYRLVNFGDAMLEQAAASDLATSRSELGSLSMATTRRLQRRAGEYVADQAVGSEVMLTTHLAVNTDAGFLPGLPDAVLSDVDPAQFVLIEADPGTILDRREAADRDYGEATRREVDFEQDLNRTAAFDYAVIADAPVRLVENDADPEAAAEDLSAAMRDAQ